MDEGTKKRFEEAVYRQITEGFARDARQRFRHGSTVAFEKRDGTTAVGVIEKLNPTSAGVVIKDPTGQLQRYRVGYALLSPAEASPNSPHAETFHVVTGRGVVTKTVVTP